MQPQQYWREIPQRYRLEAGKCGKCSKIFFPPRLVCDQCANDQFTMVQLPRTGKVLTHSVVHLGPSDFIKISPYAIAVVELDNGVKVTTQLVDVDPPEIKTGMAVRLEFRKINESGEAGVICYGYKAVPA